MLLGILEADKLDDEAQSLYGSYATMFRNLFSSVDKVINYKTYHIIDNKFPDSINECDAYLITGSKYSAYDKVTWITNLINFIQQLDDHRRPLIGICFGHQVIAEALGGNVLKSKKGWGLGTMAYDVFNQQNWMLPPSGQIRLIISHQDQVQQLPQHAILIAGNEFCPIAAYQIGQHIFSCQGHPEFTPEFANHLLSSIDPPPSSTELQLAREHLTTKNDHGLVAHWMVNFFLQQINEY